MPDSTPSRKILEIEDPIVDSSHKESLQYNTKSHDHTHKLKFHYKITKKKKKANPKTHQTIESNPPERNSATNQDHKHGKTQQLYPCCWIARHEQRRIVEWKLPIWRMMKGVWIGKMKRDNV